MDDVRKKLVELLKKVPTRNGYADLADIADFLIAHGVTAQECGEWVYDQMMPQPPKDLTLSEY